MNHNFRDNYVPLGIEARAEYWLNTKTHNYMDEAKCLPPEVRELIMNELEFELIGDQRPGNLLDCLKTYREQMLNRESEEGKDGTYVPRYAYTGNLVRKESWIYWAILADVMEAELCYRASYYELAFMVGQENRAVDRINQIGRRIKVRKPFWPFVEKTPEGAVRVRRTRRAAPLHVVPAEFPREKKPRTEKPTGRAKKR